MKLKDVTNTEKFFAAINECVDDVDLIGPGVNIHLKSPIAQMVCASMLANIDGMEELEIIANNLEDALRLLNYIAKTQ